MSTRTILSGGTGFHPVRVHIARTAHGLDAHKLRATVELLSDLARMSAPQPFRFEWEMLQGFQSALPHLLDLPRGSLITYLCRPSIWSAIPDVIAGEFCQNVTRPNRVVTGLEAHILALMEQSRQLSQEQIKTCLHLSDSGALRAFTSLTRSRLITTDERGIVRLTEQSNTREVRITAFEMKLHRWTDALEQATSYRKFADMSYVILDGSQVRLKETTITKFQENSVGLILQYGDAFQRICEARPNTDTSPERTLAVYKLLHAGIPLSVSTDQPPA